MGYKIKTIDKLLIVYILLILLLTLISCRTKKVEKMSIHTDSLVKETYLIKDSINSKTIFEYETIYDTIHNVYTTHIKKLIIEESKNKLHSASKEVKQVKNIESVTKDVKPSSSWLSNMLFIAFIITIFFLGWYIKK